MTSEETIEQALGHPARIRVLRILKKPGAGLMSIRQLARLTSLNALTLARTLRALKELGIVDYVQGGRSQLWRMVPSYATTVLAPLLDQLSQSPSLADLIERLVRSEKRAPSEIEEIILYGSSASGEATPTSDIDLCFILRREPRSVAVEQFCDRLRQRASEEIGMRISPIFISKKRFQLLKEPLRSNIRAGISLYEKNKDKTG